MPEPFDLATLALQDQTEVPRLVRDHPETQALRFGDEEYLIQAGEQSDHIFLLLKGTCAVSQHGELGAMAILEATPDQPVFVGEMAYFSRQARSASVRSCMNTWTLRLEPHVLASIIDDYPLLTQRLCQQFTLRLKEMNRLVEHFQSLHALEGETCFLQPGETLFAPGDPANTLFQLVDGRAKEELADASARVFQAGADAAVLLGSQAYFTALPHTTRMIAETPLIVIAIPAHRREAATRVFPNAVLALLGERGG